MATLEEQQWKKEQRRKYIKDAAKRVFLKKGYNTTVRDIATEAQMSDAGLYLYFKSKEDIYGVLLIDLLKNISENITRISLESELPSEEKLSVIMKIFMGIYKHNPKMMINLLHLQSAETLGRLSSEITRQIKFFSFQFIQAIASIVGEGMEQGIFIKKHPMTIADMIWGVLSGNILWSECRWHSNDNDDFTEKSLEIACNIIMEGLRAE